MAEHPAKSPEGETDKNKKAKTLLIKHAAGNTSRSAQSENENAAGNAGAAGNAEQGERRKVKVLVKKTVSVSAPKKPSPKVVVSAPSGKSPHSKKTENQTEKKPGNESQSGASRIS